MVGNPWFYRILQLRLPKRHFDQNRVLTGPDVMEKSGKSKTLIAKPPQRMPLCGQVLCPVGDT
jgi:hypothetical protein